MKTKTGLTFRVKSITESKVFPTSKTSVFNTELESLGATGGVKILGKPWPVGTWIHFEAIKIEKP